MAINKLYEKYKTHPNRIIRTIIFQLYLIHEGVRKTAQIELHLYNAALIRSARKFLDEHHISFLEKDKRFIIGKLNGLDKTFGKKYAKQLGRFYYCATRKWSKNKYRIVILVEDKFQSHELFAQMCKQENIRGKLVNVYEIMNKVTNCLQKLDKTLHVRLELYKL